MTDLNQAYRDAYSDCSPLTKEENLEEFKERLSKITDSNEYHTAVVRRMALEREKEEQTEWERMGMGTSRVVIK